LSYPPWCSRWNNMRHFVVPISKCITSHIRFCTGPFPLFSTRSDKDPGRLVTGVAKIMVLGVHLKQRVAMKTGAVLYECLCWNLVHCCHWRKTVTSQCKNSLCAWLPTSCHQASNLLFGGNDSLATCLSDFGHVLSSLTTVRHGNTYHDSLDTPPPPELQRQTDSFDTRSRSPIPPTATIQEPITSSNSRQGTPQPLPPLAHSPPLPSVTKDELLKSLLADPETKSMLISMLQSEQDNSNPPPLASQFGEPSSILEPDDGRLRNTTSTQPNPGPLPMEMSLSPAELHRAGALHTQSHDAITQTPGNPITSTSSVSLSEEEGRLPHQRQARHLNSL